MACLIYRQGPSGVCLPINYSIVAHPRARPGELLPPSTVSRGPAIVTLIEFARGFAFVLAECN